MSAVQESKRASRFSTLMAPPSFGKVGSSFAPARQRSGSIVSFRQGSVESLSVKSPRKESLTPRGTSPTPLSRRLSSLVESVRMKRHETT